MHIQISQEVGSIFVQYFTGGLIGAHLNIRGHWLLICTLTLQDAAHSGWLSRGMYSASPSRKQGVEGIELLHPIFLEDQSS